jgi:hypothetical protein
VADRERPRRPACGFLARCIACKWGVFGWANKASKIDVYQRAWGQRQFYSQQAQKGVLMGDRSEDFRSTRNFIVSVFENVCIGIALTPPAVIAIVGLIDGHPVFLAGLTFVVTVFLVGGTLTLVSVADYMEEAVRILQRIEKTELRPITDEVHRIEGELPHALRDVRAGMDER